MRDERLGNFNDQSFRWASVAPSPALPRDSEYRVAEEGEIPPRGQEQVLRDPKRPLLDFCGFFGGCWYFVVEDLGGERSNRDD